LNPLAAPEAEPIVANTTAEVEKQLGLAGAPHVSDDV
jgi:hypothetical protein